MDNNAPFRFEDLNGKPEPESWGPKYSKPQKPGKTRHREPPTNAASGQPYDFSAAKHRALMRAEFTTLCNADKRKWAENKPNHHGLTVTQAYCDAMFAKRKRLAIEAAIKPRKPHYVLRAGQWQLKLAA